MDDMAVLKGSYSVETNYVVNEVLVMVVVVKGCLQYILADHVGNLVRKIN